MPDITVTISSDGAIAPNQLNVDIGDTVTFVARADTVLCVAPANIFGEERYEIPAGREKRLRIQDDASSKIDFIVRIGDLAAPCRGGDRDRTSSGGGSVGGGPG